METASSNVKSIDGTSTGDLATAQAEGEEGHEEETSERKLEDSLYDPKFIQMLVDAEKELQRIDNERAELSASKSALISKLVNEGLNKDGVKAAIKYFRTAEEKRERFDISYQITRKALGVPVQDDLFNAAARQQVENFQKSKH